MKRTRKMSEWQAEAGAALLIAIFALLLISVVAIALVVSSGTDSALAGNYRTSTNAYYAALAGLEEGRSRLLGSNPNFINKGNPYPTLFTMQGVPSFGPSDVFYVVNPVGSETVAPTDSSNAYADTEYQTEFGVPPPTSANIINSVSPVASFPGQSFKWTRINAVTEDSLKIDVKPDGYSDPTTSLYYDPAGKDAFNNPRPSLIVSATPPPTAMQALEITSLAVLPNGSKRMLQYIVAPSLIFPGGADLTFPAALTLNGNNVTFSGPGTSGANSFYVNGQDQCSSAYVPAIGFVNAGDSSKSNIVSGATPAGNYLGFPLVGPPPPPPQTPSTSPNSIGDVSLRLRSNWLTPSGLDAIVQDITKSADAVINGNATGTGNLNSLGMSATNPLTVVVNGDLDLNAWHGVGYGLLLVTGTLKYDPDATWEGVVLVIGQGQFISTKSGPIPRGTRAHTLAGESTTTVAWSKPHKARSPTKYFPSAKSRWQTKLDFLSRSDGSLGRNLPRAAQLLPLQNQVGKQQRGGETNPHDGLVCGIASASQPNASPITRTSRKTKATAKLRDMHWRCC
jgi:hypothetical protein